MKRRVSVLAAVMGWIAGVAVLCLATTVVDPLGRVVEVGQPVLRVASTYEPGTYYLYALGVSDRLVAGWYTASSGSDSDNETMRRLESRLPEILGSGDPDAGELAARGAQLVLADGSRDAELAADLDELGVPTLLYSVTTPEALVQAMTLTGCAFGGPTYLRAMQWVLDYRRVLDTAAADAAELGHADRPRVLFLGATSFVAAGEDAYPTRLVEAAGGVSVSSNLSGAWIPVTLDQVLALDPDVIVLSSTCASTVDDLLASHEWRVARAVAAGRVHKMPRRVAPLDAPVPESMLGIAWLASVLVPSRTTFDLASEAKSFYEGYYGIALSADDLAAFTGR
ncbi:MAG: ABC transporter substrate-binding protein [Candidatus Bipolaricaulota bacterium]